ncbi:hypothetical protein BYT27DRAFT_7181675 [Phlegmacium glaucopus]|nr:hypothetical protein BYT27DRAFT_7181675 [Phlegmacium glaucopus]
MSLIQGTTVPSDSHYSNARDISYPNQVLYFIASVIALISLCHFFSISYKFITRKRVYGWKRRTAVSLARVPAAVVDSFRTLAFRWTVPIGSSHELNLAEVGATLGYMAVIFSWTFVNTTTIAGIKVAPKYYADRAGDITASQLPIMLALGMRNNIISWLTGVSYIKLNYFHRMAARVLCVLIWIHAGGRVTGSALTLLCFLTIRPIRERNYEAFLLIHFIFAFIFILGVYFHLRGRGLAYRAWPSMIIWGLDHFIRLIRLAIINFVYLNPWSSQNSRKELDAVVEVLSPDILRITLHRSRYLHWRPGQSAYLCFPSISANPWESHPFTMSTIDTDSSSGDSILVFLLRVRKGFTPKLLKDASSDQTYKVFVNGPYGAPPLLIGYQTVILIAGSFILSLHLALVIHHITFVLIPTCSRARVGKHSCQKIVFIWAIRDSDHIHWIANILAPALENIPPSISIAVQLYITAATTLNNSSKENAFEMVTYTRDSSTLRSYSTILQSPFVQVHRGRPDVKSLISQEVEEATGNISINVCGTHSLANDTRKTIQTPRLMDILRGGPTITLHVEAFG